jgi:hypothetical protein
MKFGKLKNIIALLLVGSHLGTIAWLILLWAVWGGFVFEDLTTAIGLLLPLFAGFTTAIVKEAIALAAAGADADEEKEMPWLFAFVILAFCIAFIVFLLVIVTLKGFNKGFTSFDQFKVLLGLGESAFGIYIGLLMPTLFTRGGQINVMTGSSGSAAQKDGGAGPAN